MARPLAHDQGSWREWMNDKLAVHVLRDVFHERDGDADDGTRL